MRYHVTVAGRDEPLVVELISDADGELVARVDDTEITLGLTELTAGHVLVTHNGQVSMLDVVGRGEGRYDVLDPAVTHELTVIDERDTWLSAGAGQSAELNITVAMPGKVVCVDVAEGDAVTQGQRLLVIEAMKMENDVLSPRDAVVAAIGVSAGDAVEAGQTLVELEPEE